MTTKPTYRAPASQPQKMCKTCFEVIHPDAEICPKCGVRQFNPISKGSLLLITFFLGGLGVHKFYLGKHVQGVFYLLFCWTAIPGIIAFVEFLIFAFTDEDRLQRRYPNTRSSAAGIAVACVAGALGIFAVMGILAAIAIPQFAAYRQRAACVVVEQEAQRVSMAVSQYFMATDQNRVPSVDELVSAVEFSPNETVAIEVSGTRDGYTIQVTDKRKRCRDGQSYVVTEPSAPGRSGWQ